METAQVENGIKKVKDIAGAAEERIEGAEHALKHRVAEARDVVADLKERAELAIQERPYLVPVAAAAAGFGVGVLFGSKLSRLLLVTAAGALLSDTIRGQVKRISQDFIRDVGLDGAEGGAEDVEEEGEPSVA